MTRGEIAVSRETASGQADSDSGTTAHSFRFWLVFDSRNRRVPCLKTLTRTIASRFGRIGGGGGERSGGFDWITLLASLCVNKLPCVLGRNAFPSACLLPRDTDARQQFDLASDFLQRGVLRELGQQVDDDFTVAHAGIVSGIAVVGKSKCGRFVIPRSSGDAGSGDPEAGLFCALWHPTRRDPSQASSREARCRAQCRKASPIRSKIR